MQFNTRNRTSNSILRIGVDASYVIRGGARARVKDTEERKSEIGSDFNSAVLKSFLGGGGKRQHVRY